MAAVFDNVSYTILREGNAPTSAFTSTLDNSCVFKQAEIVIHIHVVKHRLHVWRWGHSS